MSVNEYPEVEIIGKLMALAARYGLEELEVEEGGLKVELTAAQRPAEDSLELSMGTYRLWSPPALVEAEASTRPETAHPLLAPLSGIFYRANSPDADPFVEVGQTIEAGTQIGLIEAMKVFSPIEADVSGTVVEIPIRNGALVQHGDVLLYIDPIAT